MDDKKLKQLFVIRRLSQKDKKWIHRDIFRILNKDEIWILAYENIKGNKGALTPGSTSETLDGLSLQRVMNLKNEVCSEKYKFKPVKRIYIPKTDGRRRPLGLPTVNDKIVQEVIRIILEAIYEPVFVEESFGFRSGLGCHDALHHVEQKFRWIDYVIEGDIENAYPTIDHHILVNILEKRIKDSRFIRLIWKLLKCGIIEENQEIWLKTGVPQGSIVSPILANIYYQELDEHIQELKMKYETPKSEQNKQKNPAYKYFEHKIAKVTEKLRSHEPQSPERKQLAKELKQLRAERLTVNSLKNKTIRVEYVRYADDWMVGVSGNRKLAQTIKEDISEFMIHSLKQKIHPYKTKVTDLRQGNVHFLGYDIFLPRNRPISSYKGKGVKTIRRGQPQLRFDVPVNKITKRYTERGYLKQKPKGVRPISRSFYTVLEDHVIVSHYRSIWLGLLNYYSGCTNRGRLQYIHYLLHMSCAMTLGHRHRMSCSKIFKKHGKTLKVKISDTDKTVSFPYKTSWRLKERKWLRGKKVNLPTYSYMKNLVSRSSLELPCAICDSTEAPIEMHHVKHVRKNGYRYKGFHQQMTLLNRKQIPLCKDCHQKVHSGVYDGPSLETLRKQMRKTVGS
uniref:Putative reverse transcriptase and intron maturase n=1 Tax=Halamphora calidilacuna TaxID=2133758 RepID=A0A516ZBI8_9STRA|nr:putative reverse transcriptase and intron maturase [Halamphora calidilacuna]QDR25075.1 putative reverse transcriptase and intron maturase [Halamphora calidilacuna]